MHCNALPLHKLWPLTWPSWWICLSLLIDVVIIRSDTAKYCEIRRNTFTAWLPLRYAIYLLLLSSWRKFFDQIIKKYKKELKNLQTFLQYSLIENWIKLILRHSAPFVVELNINKVLRFTYVLHTENISYSFSTTLYCVLLSFGCELLSKLCLRHVICLLQTQK